MSALKRPVSFKTDEPRLLFYCFIQVLQLKPLFNDLIFKGSQSFLYFNENFFEAGFLSFLLCASYCVVCSECIIQSKLLNTERVYLNNLKRYLEDNSICIIYYGEDKKLFEEIISQHKTKDYKGYWLN